MEFGDMNDVATIANDWGALSPYVTYEDTSCVTFQFPMGVMGNFYGACMWALKVFTDIRVETDESLRFALRVDAKKRPVCGWISQEKYMHHLEQKLRLALSERNDIINENFTDSSHLLAP